ncbi:uncharacterized protein LOC135463183 [Liolophura sinensis]|uniref:uncharacterized protein LOC135463183 n=1 Tax=Liolophura sinensis TaxID=3198878 RepID=UPI00315820F3
MKTNISCIQLSICLIFKVIVYFASSASCHGYMKYPPSRGSLRDFGYENAAVNYDVHGQNCGGKLRQWTKNSGKCGVCGDPYDVYPRQHEAPDGKFATGTIVKRYNQGRQLDVEVVMTWGHRGWMEFRLCPIDNKNTPPTQECLDKYLLSKSGSDETRMAVEAFGKREIIRLSLDLPTTLVCSQCVLQWKYHTGKDWGCEPTGKCGLGLGPQEEFYTCADIAIDPSTPRMTTTTTTLVSTTTTTAGKTTRPVPKTITRTVTTTTIPSPTKAATTTTTSTRRPTTTLTPSPAISHTATSTRRITDRTTRSREENEALVWACRAIGNRGLFYDNWCRGNCRMQFCPRSFCNDDCQRLKPY